MQSFKVPDGIKLTLYDSCFSQLEQTFTGPIESTDGAPFAGIASSFKVEEVIGGCCQYSETDNACFYAEYEYGRCKILSSRTIGCNRGLWVERAKYDEESGTCIRQLTAAEAEALAEEEEKKNEQDLN